MDIREGRELELGRLRRERGGAAQRTRSGPRDERRSGAGRPQQHAPRLQHARAAEAEHRGSVAGGRRQAGVPAQQPQEGPVQRRAVAGEVAPSRDRNRRSSPCGFRPTRISATRSPRSRCAQDCFEGGVEAIPWEQRKPYDEFDYGYVLTVHKSQGSQWDDVVLFDESFAFPGQPRALALHRGITRAAKRLERGGVGRKLPGQDAKRIEPGSLG